MTRNELLKELHELEEREFFLNMVDRWTNEDRKAYNAINAEIRRVRKALNNTTEE